MRNLRSNVKRIAAASVAAAGLSLVALPSSAWANNADNPPTSPLSGSDTTTFTFLTTGGFCSTASTLTGGDSLDSFVVDDSKVPASQLQNLTFPGGVPTMGTYTGAVLDDASGPFTSRGTNPPTTGTQGNWGNNTEGPFNWNTYIATGDYGPGNDIYDGTWDIGIACVTQAGTIDNGEFWSSQMSFTSGGTNALPFNWASQPGPTTPEVPLALILPLSGAGILLAGVFLMRRRQRHSTVAVS
jgi:hypothetical protein